MATLLFSSVLVLLCALTIAVDSSVGERYIRGHASTRNLQGSVSLRFMEAGYKDKKIFDLTDGAVFNLRDLPVRLNVEAVLLAGVTVPSSIMFGFNGISNFKKETSAPYAMCGDVGGVFNDCSAWRVGRYTISATPSGGTKYTVSFTIVDGPATPTAIAPESSPPPPVPVSSPITAPVAISPPEPVPSPITAPVVISPPVFVPSPIAPVVTSPQVCGIPKVSVYGLCIAFVVALRPISSFVTFLVEF
jgi:hypothetical protein